MSGFCYQTDRTDLGEVGKGAGGNTVSLPAADVKTFHLPCCLDPHDQCWCRLKMFQGSGLPGEAAPSTPSATWASCSSC